MPQILNQHIGTESQQNISVDSINYVVKQVVQPAKFQYLNHQFKTSIPTIDPDLNLKPLPFQAKTALSGSTLFWTFSAIVLLWSLIFQNNFKAIKNLGDIFLNNSALSNEVNDRSSGNGLVSIGVFFTSIAVLSVFAYQLITELNPVIVFQEFLQSPSSILIIAFVIIFGLFAKTLLVLLSSFIFQSGDVLNSYLTLNINSIQILGTVLFPIVVFSSFGIALNTLWVLGFGVILTILFFIIRLSRSFFLGVKQTNSQVFHIILYICALEILPLLVISKLLFVK